jgi:hypothetical protein
MAPEFSPLLVGLVLPNISFYVVFCKSLFVSYLAQNLQAHNEIP